MMRHDPATKWKQLNVFAVLLGLFSLSTVYSLRGVWVNMNGFLSGPFGFYANWVAVLMTVFALATLVLLVNLIAQIRGQWRRATRIGNILALLFVLFQAACLYVLYGQTKDLYWETTLSHLSGNGVFVVAAIIALATGLVFRKRVNTWTERAFLAADSVLTGVLFCALYLALFVHEWDYGNHPQATARTVERSVDEEPRNGYVEPWAALPLDTEYGGVFLLAGDVDNDHEIEIITAKSYVVQDVHHIVSFAVQKLNGARLWTWGEKNREVPQQGSNLGIQVYDLNGDGRNEVLMATEGYLYELEGATGKELRKLRLPASDASDNITFANLRGGPEARDLLLKDAYHQVWAYDDQFHMLWTVRNPGGFMLAHRMMPCDVDHDGKDEVFAGSALLNSDGTVRKVFSSPRVKLWYGGHIDSIVPIEQHGQLFVAMSYCDGCGIGLFRMDGTEVFEYTGYDTHFEYVAAGYFYPGRDEFQIMSNVHYMPKGGKAPTYVFNQNGSLAAVFTHNSAGLYAFDWDGDGYHEILFSNPPALYDGNGRKLYGFHIPESSYQKGQGTNSTKVADMTGDGIPDVILRFKDMLYIYKNDKGMKPRNGVVFGMGCEETANYHKKFYQYR